MVYINSENSQKLLSSSAYEGIELQASEKGAVSSAINGRVNRFPIIRPNALGDLDFKKEYGLVYAYMAGAMAHFISSPELCISLARIGALGCLGTGGCSLEMVGDAIDHIRSQIGDRAFSVNILASNDYNQEWKLVNLIIDKKITIIEVSAYILISEALVYYRLHGVKLGNEGEIHVPNRLIAKISREEIFEKFMAPPDKKIVQKLFSEGMITDEEAKLAELIPMADDITAEADSGGHTDGRPLISLLPGILVLRDSLQKKYSYKKKVRVGAAGGIATGLSAMAAFLIGADYIVTGSINHACVEAGTSSYVKGLLSSISMADVVLAPSADMFESGAKVQVVKRGTMYSQHANFLYECYVKYDSIYDIPSEECKKIENNIMHCTLEQIWQETKGYFNKIDPSQIQKAEHNPKKKMALIFRWYLGNSSKWAVLGDLSRKMDMQIWCGQSMGAFNSWVRGSYLESPDNRNVSDIVKHIMKAAAYEYTRYLLILCGACEEDYSHYKFDR